MSFVAAPVTLTVNVGVPLSIPAYCVVAGNTGPVATLAESTLTLSASASANAFTIRTCAPLLLLLFLLLHPTRTAATRHRAASRIRFVRMITPELGGTRRR